MTNICINCLKKQEGKDFKVMLSKYIDFVTSLFPSISPYVQEQAKFSIKQFYDINKTFSCFTKFIDEDLLQGDIITQIPFVKINDDGEEEEFVTDGLIISNSCDIENDKYILIAPFIPVENLEEFEDINALKNNTIYRLLYFPDCNYSQSVADLALISSFPKNRILEKLKNKEIIRKYSLNQIGYYLLISKLTVHLLRPEDKTIQKIR